MSAIAAKSKRPQLVTSVRPDYQQQEWWTIGEAVEYTGKCEAAINAWIREGKFSARSSFTAYRVYSPEFIRFIDTGKPQIPVSATHSSAQFNPRNKQVLPFCRELIRSTFAEGILC